MDSPKREMGGGNRVIDAWRWTTKDRNRVRKPMGKIKKGRNGGKKGLRKDRVWKHGFAKIRQGKCQKKS